MTDERGLVQSTGGHLNKSKRNFQIFIHNYVTSTYYRILRISFVFTRRETGTRLLRAYQCHVVIGILHNFFGVQGNRKTCDLRFRERFYNNVLLHPPLFAHGRQQILQFAKKYLKRYLLSMRDILINSKYAKPNFIL